MKTDRPTNPSTTASPPSAASSNVIPSSPRRRRRAETTSADLIDEVYRALPNVSRQEAAVLFDLMLELMARALERGEFVRIRGFGRLSVVNIKGRRYKQARRKNLPDHQAPPRTVIVPPKKVVRFRLIRQ